MTQQARIRGEVRYRAGDGMPIPIPEGPVSIDLATDSAVLSWEDGPGNAMSATLTRDEYQRYLSEGKIKLS